MAARVSHQFDQRALDHRLLVGNEPRDHRPRRFQRGGEPFGESGQALVLVDAGGRAVGNGDEADGQMGIMGIGFKVGCATRVVNVTGTWLTVRVRSPPSTDGRARGSGAAVRRARVLRSRRATSDAKCRRSACGVHGGELVERRWIGQQPVAPALERRRSVRCLRRGPLAQRSSASRIGAESTSRISLPTYCIWRRRPSWARMPRACRIASARRSGRSSSVSRRGSRATSASPRSCSACIACLRRVLEGGAAAVGGDVVLLVGSGVHSGGRGAGYALAGWAFAIITDPFLPCRTTAGNGATAAMRRYQEPVHDPGTRYWPFASRAARREQRPGRPLSRSPRANSNALRAAILDAARSGGATAAETEVSQAIGPERHRAQGRSRDHRLQPRQGHRRHRVRRQAARQCQHRGFLRRIDARDGRQGARDRALHRGGRRGRPRGSGAARDRLARSRPLPSVGPPGRRAIELGREAEAAALAVDSPHHQQRGRDGRPRRIGVRLREFARLRRRLSQLAPPHRLLRDRRGRRRDAARLLVHRRARPRRPAWPRTRSAASPASARRAG